MSNRSLPHTGFYVCLIFLIAFVLRLVYLDRIPTGISGDELDYVFTSKIVYQTGTDATKTWYPWSLTTPPGETPKAELPYLLIAPIIGPLPFSLFAARLPYVLANIILLAATIVISWSLFNKQIGLIAGFLTAVNPWNIYMARTSFDSPLSAACMYVGLALLITQKGWRILWSCVFFFLGFYTYIGAKTVFLPFMITAIVGSYFLRKRQFLVPYSVVLVLCTGIFLHYIVTNVILSHNVRAGDIYTPWSEKNAEQVNSHRRLSVENPLSPIMTNKFTVYIFNRLDIYGGFFSPQYLLLHGDGRSAFSVWENGVLYVVDGVVLLISVYYLFRYRRKVGLYILGLLIIAPLPSVISNVGQTYSIRANLAFPLLIILIAIGLWYLIKVFPRPKLTAGIIVLIYSILTIQFMYTYLYRNPIYNAEGLSFSERIAARYIALAHDRGEKVVITNDEITLPRAYLFFQNRLSSDTIDQIRAVLNGKGDSIDSINLVSCDRHPDFSEDTIVISTEKGPCRETEEEYITIPQLSDGGGIYRIYHDTICSQYELPRYPSRITMKKLAVESLSEKEFCETFITDFF